MTADNTIIILKRVQEEDEKRKGGVWKIAHADFMTAMMAFFLIMWLVNATDEEMRKSIANYFNPINLTNSSEERRGLMDPPDTVMPSSSGEAAGESGGARPTGSDARGTTGEAGGGGNVESGNRQRMDSAGILEETDGAEFHDPYASMASSTSDIAPDQPVSVDSPRTTQGEAGRTALSQELRDPFDPVYWQTRSPRPARTLRPGPADAADRLPPKAVIDARDRRPTEPSDANASSPQDVDGSAIQRETRESGASRPAPSVGPRSAAADTVMATLGADPQPAGADSTRTAPKETLTKTAEALKDVLKETEAGVSVRVEERRGRKSLLLSLTDERAFSMFPIGSASPTADAQELFDRVAGILAARDGAVVVRGHTDARPFRGASQDNWTLSFSRAHATKQALVAGGVSEERIVGIEGLADRIPARPDDPRAAENRRIEILYAPETGGAE